MSLSVQEVYIIRDLINKRLNKVLLFAESSLPRSQFLAFRKLTLDEFGKSGIEKELEWLSRSTREGKERLGQEKF